jgi:hypothetical protein
MDQDPSVRNENQFVISYLTMRRSIGILGISLSPVLLIGFYILNKTCDFPPSISHYYFTNLGTYFTGTLCAISLFLFSYKGPADTDRNAALLASICALGVAFFPTNPYTNVCSCVKVYLEVSSFRNFLHYTSAGLLFLTLAYFCLVLFTKTSPDKGPTPQKKTRNRIYRVCGIIIIICIICVPVFSSNAINLLPGIKEFKAWTFVFETIALFAFGYSWLIKGETFFKDK